MQQLDLPAIGVLAQRSSEQLHGAAGYFNGAGAIEPEMLRFNPQQNS